MTDNMLSGKEKHKRKEKRYENLPEKNLLKTFQ